MGMRACYYRRSPGELERLEADPRAGSEELLDDRPTRGSERSVSFEKGWHALNFLLTGNASPSPPVGRTVEEQVVGGARTSPIESAYGNLRVLDPAAVQNVARLLAGIDARELANRFDASRFNEAKIYPFGRSGQWSPERIELVLMVYPRLQSFFSQAAADGDAVIVGIDRHISMDRSRRCADEYICISLR